MVEATESTTYGSEMVDVALCLAGFRFCMLRLPWAAACAGNEAVAYTARGQCHVAMARIQQQQQLLQLVVVWQWVG